MVTLKNISKQTIEIYVKGSTEPIKLMPRDKISVKELNEQMKNLESKKILKKVSQ